MLDVLAIVLALTILLIAPGWIICELWPLSLVDVPRIVRIPAYFSVGVLILGLVATMTYPLEIPLRPFAVGYFSVSFLTSLGIAVWRLRHWVSVRGRPTASARSVWAWIARERWTVATGALALGMGYTLSVVGNYNGIGFDEWTHISSQHYLIEQNRVFSPIAFDPLIRESDGAALVTSHDIYDLWFAMASVASNFTVSELVFGAAGFLALLEILGFYFMARSLFRSQSTGFLATIIFALLYGGDWGGWVRAANVRHPAAVLIFVGLAFTFRWMWKHERRQELLLGSVIGIGAFIIHGFYLIVWFGVLAPVVIVFACYRTWRPHAMRVMVYAVFGLLILSPYVVPKLLALSSQLIMQDSGEGAASSGGRANSVELLTAPENQQAAPDPTWTPSVRERGGHRWLHLTDRLFILRPFDLFGTERVIALWLLGMLGILLMRRRKSLPEVVLIALVGAPILLFLNPLLTPILESVATPNRITRLAPRYIAAPLIFAYFLAPQLRKLLRESSHHQHVALALASVLLVGLVPQSVEALTYSARISHLDLSADRSLRDLQRIVRTARDGGVPSGTLVASPPVQGLWLELYSDLKALYAAPRDQVTEWGWGRSYDTYEAGVDAGRITDHLTDVNTKIAILEQHRMSHVLLDRLEGGAAVDLFSRHRDVFDVVASNDSYVLYRMIQATEDRARLYLRESRTAARNGDVAQAAILVEEGLKLSPNDRDLRAQRKTIESRASHLTKRADELQSKGRIQEAYEVARRATGAMNYLSGGDVPETHGAKLEALRDALLTGGHLRQFTLGQEEIDYRFSKPPSGYDPALDREFLIDGSNTPEENWLFDWTYLDTADIEFEIREPAWISRVTVMSNAPIDNYKIRSLELLTSLDGEHFRSVGVITQVRHDGAPIELTSLGRGEHVFEFRVDRPVEYAILRISGIQVRGHTMLGEVQFWTETPDSG